MTRKTTGQKHENYPVIDVGCIDVLNVVYAEHEMNFNNDFPIYVSPVIEKPVIEEVVVPVIEEVVIELPKPKKPMGLWLVVVGLLICGGIAGWWLTRENPNPWSDWVVELPQAVTKQTHQIEEGLLYRSRVKITTVSTVAMDGWIKDEQSPQQWGEWSPWGTSTLSASETIEVEQREVIDTGLTKTVHQYSRWMYINIKDEWYSSYTDYQGDFYKKGGRWERIVLDTPLKSKGLFEGVEHFGEYCYGDSGCSWKSWWWNYQPVEVTLPNGKHLEYRYRQLGWVYYQWGEWSSWGAQELVADNNQEVESTKGYRYRLK